MEEQILSRKFADNHNIAYMVKEGVEFIQFNNLRKYSDVITHCFTTRKGGVSKGEYESLNMALHKKDDMDSVVENYKRVAKALSLDIDNMVLSNQVHDSKIYIAKRNDRGKGIIGSSDIKGFDGLVTNEENVVLVTFFADCVPVFLFDPVKKVIGLVHSGWKGTVKEISKEALKKMNQEFGCDYRDIEAAIGPSIGKCCFEVGKEVAEEFEVELDWFKEAIRESSIKNQECYISEKNGKWFIDLPLVIKKTLLNQGMDEENIVLSGICTKCNKDVFFSHRGDMGKTGTLAGIMQINSLLQNI